MIMSYIHGRRRFLHPTLAAGLERCAGILSMSGSLPGSDMAMRRSWSPQEVSGSALWDPNIPQPSFLVGDPTRPMRLSVWRLPVATALVEANKETIFGPKGGNICSPKGCERGPSGAEDESFVLVC
jgi:hypothetical protein